MYLCNSTILYNFDISPGQVDRSDRNTKCLMSDLRDLDREIAKISSGLKHIEERSPWYSRTFNTLNWLKFLNNWHVTNNEKIGEYENTFLRIVRMEEALPYKELINYAWQWARVFEEADVSFLKWTWTWVARVLNSNITHLLSRFSYMPARMNPFCRVISSSPIVCLYWLGNTIWWSRDRWRQSYL